MNQDFRQQASEAIWPMGKGCTWWKGVPWCGNAPDSAAILWLGLQAILEQESRIAGFKGEVAKSQELHLASLSRDTERLTNSLEKMRAEIK